VQGSPDEGENVMKKYLALCMILLMGVTVGLKATASGDAALSNIVFFVR
jgi:hypothetical protein